ncbi:MAG: site-2 protease family protein [Gemmatimonadales bacterium]
MSFEDILLLVPVLLFSIVAHEYAHGEAAYRQGDTTAYMLGRLTLNPLKHIDPFLTIVLPVMLIAMGGPPFGGAKPVPVNPRNYRNYVSGDIIVSLAGIATNLALFLLCIVGFVVIGFLGHAIGGLSGSLAVLQRMMYIGMWVNTGLAFFNLMPIPPLDGSHVLKHLLPAAAGMRYRQIYALGIIPILIVVWLLPGVVDAFMWPARTLMGVAQGLLIGFALPGSM